MMGEKVSVDHTGLIMPTGMRLDTLDMKGMMGISGSVYRIVNVLSLLSKHTLPGTLEIVMMTA